MADNHQHRGNSHVMTLYERQASRAHVVVSSMMPEHAHSEKQTAMAVTASDTCIKCVDPAAITRLPRGVLPIKGVAKIPVRYQSEVVELPLVIVSGNIPAPLGRNWMEMMKLDWSSIRAVTLETGIASVG